MPKRPRKAAKKRARNDEPEHSARDTPPTNQPTQQLADNSQRSYQGQKRQALSKESENQSKQHPSTPKYSNVSLDSRASKLPASPLSVQPSSRDASPVCEPMPELSELPLKAIPRKFDVDIDFVCVAALIQLQDKLGRARPEKETEDGSTKNTDEAEEVTEVIAEKITAEAADQGAEGVTPTVAEENTEEATDRKFETWCKCERGDVEGCSGSIECEDPRCERVWYHWECLSDLERELAKTWRMWLCRACWERRAEDYFISHWVDWQNGKRDFSNIPDSKDLEDRIYKRVMAAIPNESDLEESESETERESEEGDSGGSDSEESELE